MKNWKVILKANGKIIEDKITANSKDKAKAGALRSAKALYKIDNIEILDVERIEDGDEEIA